MNQTTMYLSIKSFILFIWGKNTIEASGVSRTSWGRGGQREIGTKLYYLPRCLPKTVRYMKEIEPRPCTRLDPQCRKIHGPRVKDLAPSSTWGHGKCMFHSIGIIAPGPWFWVQSSTMRGGACVPRTPFDPPMEPFRSGVKCIRKAWTAWC